jgi:hypothetical protein
MTPNTTPTEDDMNTASQNNPGVRLLIVAWANEDLEIVASDEVKQQMRKSDPDDQRSAARMCVPLYAICDGEGNPLFIKQHEERKGALADRQELLAQVERLAITCAAYQNAYRVAYQATFQSHNGHWDKTQRGGEGCPECIRAREARENRDSALREGLQQLIKRVTPSPAVQEPQGGWEHLKAYGYAPGNYMSRCHSCCQVVSGLDKRAMRCRPCAEAVAAPHPTEERKD